MTLSTTGGLHTVSIERKDNKMIFTSSVQEYAQFNPESKIIAFLKGKTGIDVGSIDDRLQKLFNKYRRLPDEETKRNMDRNLFQVI